MVAAIIKNISYKSYLDYENTILSQQSSHILTIAKSTSENIEFYIGEKVREIKNLTKNILLLEKEDLSLEGIEEELILFLEFQNEVSRISYVSGDKNTIITYCLENIANMVWALQCEDIPNSIK